MRLASRTVALTATSWAPSVESCPEGPTRLDREIRVGVPARRADGSGRRTAGRWVAPPAVAAVRFSGLGVVGRDSLERDSGRPREFLGALMTPRGPIAGTGGFARRQPDGFLGVVLTGALARIGHLPRAIPVPAASAYRSPQVTARPGHLKSRAPTRRSLKPPVLAPAFKLWFR